MGNAAVGGVMQVHPVILSFYQISEYGLAQVVLKENSLATWGGAFSGSHRVGVSLETSPPGTSLCINRFIINKKCLAISVGRDCPEIRIRLYAHDSDSCLDGTVVLPSGASMKIESAIDRVLVERGSFCLRLSEK